MTRYELNHVVLLFLIEINFDIQVINYVLNFLFGKDFPAKPKSVSPYYDNLNI